MKVSAIKPISTRGQDAIMVKGFDSEGADNHKRIRIGHQVLQLDCRQLVSSRLIKTIHLDFSSIRIEWGLHGESKRRMNSNLT